MLRRIREARMENGAFYRGILRLLLLNKPLKKPWDVLNILPLHQIFLKNCTYAFVFGRNCVSYGGAMTQNIFEAVKFIFPQKAELQS